MRRRGKSRCFSEGGIEGRSSRREESENDERFLVLLLLKSLSFCVFIVQLLQLLTDLDLPGLSQRRRQRLGAFTDSYQQGSRYRSRS